MRERNRIVYSLRQWYIMLGKCFFGMSCGTMLAYPTVLVPAITNNEHANSTDHIYVSLNEAYWIVTSNGIASLFGLFILTPIMQIYGRRSLQLLQTSLLFIGWVIMALANSAAALFAARIVQGLTVGGTLLNPIIISEFSHPRRRGYFQTLEKVSVFFGVLVCHSCGEVHSWILIPIIAIFCTVSSLILVYFWPESPAWLASRGRFVESEKSWNWLFGGSQKSKSEMETLLSTQKERFEMKQGRKRDMSILKKVWQKMKMRDFQKAFLIASLVSIILEASGKHYFIAYAMQLMVELIDDKSMTIYCTVSVDVITVIGLLCSCVAISFFRRRTLLFTFGYFATFLLLTLSTITFAKSHYNIGANLTWLSTAVFMVFMFLTNVGVLPVCFAIIGEVFPLEHKGVGTCLTGLIFLLLYSVTLQLTPLITATIGLEGTYFIFGMTQLIALSLLFIILPETKDRTLQDIENEIKGKNNNNVKIVYDKTVKDEILSLNVNDI